LWAKAAGVETVGPEPNCSRPKGRDGQLGGLCARPFKGPRSIEAGLKSQLPKELAVVLQPCEAQPLELGLARDFAL